MSLPQRLVWVIALAVGFLASGCFATPVILAHDKILGPISPFGYLRPAVAGREFDVNEHGLVVDVAGLPILRPYSPDIISVLAPRPSSWWRGWQGIMAFNKSNSFILQERWQAGQPLTREQVDGLRPGIHSSKIMSALGAPQLWIRRKTGSIMSYRADVTERLALYLGTPPGLSNFVPIPGIGSINFKFRSKWSKPYKTILFFDANDRLLLAIPNKIQIEGAEEME